MSRPVVALAVGNGRFQDELGDALVPRLQVERCRTDVELLAQLGQGALAAAIVGQDLLGLRRQVLPALLRTRTPTVLLVDARDVERRQAELALADAGAPVRVLALDTAPETIAATLEDLRTGGPPGTIEVGRVRIEVPRPPDPPPQGRPTGRVFGMVGTGGVGASTQVANLLVALGETTPTVAVDLDPIGPLLVPLLDLDPSLGLAGVLRVQEAGVSSLERAVDSNLQPLAAALHAPHARVLGGLPLDAVHGRPNGSADSVGAELIEPLLAVLRQRFEVVLVDAGRLLPPVSRAGLIQRAALLGADGILVTIAGDRPGILRAIDQLAGLVAISPHPDPARLALVLGRYDRQTMDPPEEIAVRIGLPLAACVPIDDGAMRRAVWAHRPVAVDGTSPAARASCALAAALLKPAWPPRRASTRPVWARIASGWRRARRLFQPGRPPRARRRHSTERARRAPVGATPEGT